MEDTEKRSMRELVVQAGGLMLPGENRKAWIARIARITGLAPRVVRAAYYQESTSRIAAAKLKAAAENEANQIAQQLEEMAAKLEIHDADFFSPEADRLRGAARAWRGMHRSPRSASSD